MTEADKKAKKLVERFYDNIDGLETEQAKQCALICVDEIYEWQEDGKAETGFIELEKLKHKLEK